MIVRYWSFLCLLACVAAAHKTERNNDNEETPYLELASPEEGYHGLVRENETIVEVTPTIHARGPLCSYLILNNKHHGEAPFEIMVTEENKARLRVRYPLNCEKRRNYKFDIAAVGCDGSYSNTVPVHITVTDVNEYAPVFTQSAYVGSVDEGRMYDEIVKVTATDRDCTPHYGDVCKYHILNKGIQPFDIDNDGVIRNTEPLEYEVSHNHILSVVAYDCGMKESAPVMVTIKVNKPCKPGWKGIAERIEYAPGMGPLSLFPEARLAPCTSDVRCPAVTRVSAHVTLQASRAGTGCDRDTYSIHKQKILCDLNAKTVDLLPAPGPGNEWANSLKPDTGIDTTSMYSFDGSETSAVVPPSLLPHELAGTFSITTWMRHAQRSDGDKHRKEHLLCLADDHKMNRHHYALFVRNCRLILLLRRDFGNGDLNIFRPAEWRWKLPEVCDNQWHHYALNVRFPSVELYVDGVLWRPNEAIDSSGPEVIDDWPLHPAHGLNTTLTVGACWQGTETDMKHHLEGWLAGLGVLRHELQRPDVLKCVAQCSEGLSLAPDLYLKSVSVEGDGVEDVETLLRKVSYGDGRMYPTPGRRNVRLTTTITCDNGRVISAGAVESSLVVSRPLSPGVTVTGTGGSHTDYDHFRRGLAVFPDLTLNVTHPPADGPGKIESCVVSVYPALNPDHESLRAGVPHLGDVRVQLSRDGATLLGTDTPHTYQKMLRALEYSNKKPAYYLNRVFKLTCSELSGRFTSNEYVQTLTVVHPHMSANEASHPSGMADKLDTVRETNEINGPILSPRAFVAHAQVSDHVQDQPLPRTTDIHHHEASGVSMVMIGVLAGVAAIVIAIAAVRIRRHTPAPDLVWDHSALHITLNPMEQTEVERGPPSRGDGGAVAVDSSDDSSDDSDQRDDDDDDDDDEDDVLSTKQHKYRNISQLEWDNSTM